MHELIKYISDILNIKTESVYTIQDMTEELSKIKDIVAYRSYIKNNLNSIEFKSGYQKFLILTQEYLLMEYVALNPKMKDDGEKLLRKAMSFIFNGRFLHGLDDATRKELAKLGSAEEIQRLLDTNTFMSTFIKSKIDKHAYEELPNRLKEMTKQLTKEIK